MSNIIRPPLLFCLIGIVLALINIFSQPTLFIRANGNIIAMGRGESGEPISIHFIHSVQKTPVLENLAVENEELVLHSTVYQSFGVGLPFLASEGNFHKEGSYYVLDNMERRFKNLTLRVGVGTKLTLFLGGRSYPLYASYPAGTPIDIYVKPLLKGMLGYERK